MGGNHFETTRPTEGKNFEAPKMLFQFRLHYHTGFGQTVHIAGSLEELGKWNWHKAPKMDWKPGDYWTLSLPLPNNFEYKYIIVNDYNNEVRWEECANRIVKEEVQTHQVTDIDDHWAQPLATKISRTLVAGLRRKHLPKQSSVPSELERMAVVMPISANNTPIRRLSPTRDLQNHHPFESSSPFRLSVQ
jgi:hypothetical protein